MSFGYLFGTELGIFVEMYVFCEICLLEFLWAFSVGICCGNCLRGFLLEYLWEFQWVCLRGVLWAFLFEFLWVCLREIIWDML